MLKYQTLEKDDLPNKGTHAEFGAFGFVILNMFRISDFVLRICMTERRGDPPETTGVGTILHFLAVLSKIPVLPVDIYGAVEHGSSNPEKTFQPKRPRFIPQSCTA